MLKQARTILAMIVIVLSLFSLLTNNMDIFPFTLIVVAVLMLVVGIIEFQKKKMWIGIACILVFAFLIFIAIQGFVVG
jgi:FtsH-binding integral membrane protein